MIVAVHKINVPGEPTRLLFEDQRGYVYESTDDAPTMGDLGITFVGKLLRGAAKVVKTVASTATGGGSAQVQSTPVSMPAKQVPTIIQIHQPPQPVMRNPVSTPPKNNEFNWIPVAIAGGIVVLGGIGIYAINKLSQPRLHPSVSTH
ncbi:MAG: hypothetical protein K2X86_18425 [Cytophagaceae bacterium]|nr:hypothetical protein [Cytophagaceae bacterium]